MFLNDVSYLSQVFDILPEKCAKLCKEIENYRSTKMHIGNQKIIWISCHVTKGLVSVRMTDFIV